MKKITFTLLLLVVSVYMASQTVLSGTRDMWKWPFADNSIWNMPIGSGATYQPANLLAEYAIGYNLVQLLEMKSEYPIVNVRNNTGGNTPCDGTTSLGFTLQIPSDWVVPNTPGFAFRTPSSNEVMQGAQVARCIVEGPVYLPDYMQWENNRTLHLGFLRSGRPSKEASVEPYSLCEKSVQRALRRTGSYGESDPF